MTPTKRTIFTAALMIGTAAIAQIPTSAYAAGEWACDAASGAVTGNNQPGAGATGTDLTAAAAGEATGTSAAGTIEADATANNQSGAGATGTDMSATSVGEAAASGSTIDAGAGATTGNNQAGAGATGTDTGASASSMVTRSGPFDQAAARTLLTEQKYADVSEINCTGGAWTAKARQDNADVNLRINPDTGAVEKQ